MQIPVTTSGRTHPYHPNVRPRLFFAGLVLTSTLSAQLSNNGQPMRVNYPCAEDDLQWAGMSCDDETPCPIYLELSSVVPDGAKIIAVGNLHTESATLTSILLLSDDAGATWKEPMPGIRGSALDQVQFYNLQTGWAAGETQYPLARDPYFLLTTDGGSTWRSVTVEEDGSPGAIQRFWFDSAKHGDLIVDAGKSSEGGRYLSFESETGGDNWMLRGKSDQLPKLLHAPLSPEDSGLRIRPSKDGNAFQIEQRTGEQWKPVASFLIETAVCKIHTEELKEPAAPQPEPETPTAPTQRRRK
jgi:hypothetical protein